MRVARDVGFAMDLPLVSQADTKLWKTTPTLAAGDFKVQNDRLALVTLTTKTRAFTSGGTYEVVPGDTITGATSGATAIVVAVRPTSGTAAGGDLAGIYVLEQDSGTFQSENLNVGSNTNVATIGGALSAAGVVAEWATGMVVAGVASAHNACRQGALVARDAAGAEWCDTGDRWETEGHELAFDPKGCILTDTVHASDQTTTNVRLSAQPTVAPQEGFFVVVYAGTGINQCFYVSSYSTAGGKYQITPDQTLNTALDSTSKIKVYVDAKYGRANLIRVAGTTQTAGDVPALLTALFTTALTESYSTLGSAPTVAQALMEIRQMLENASASGTTLTVYKKDGTTPAMTFTLNSATDPTTITRAS